MFPMLRQMTMNRGRLAFRIALVSCYLLTVFGGSFHYVLHHLDSHGDIRCVSTTLPAFQSDCDSERHSAVTKDCQVCVSLVRSLGTNPNVTADAVQALAPMPHLPLAAPATTMPYRPHLQRGPPVQV